MALLILALQLFLACQGLAANSPDPEPQAEGKHWAVLIAGSRGWFNYRHQADICHAYQILRKHGIPDERIIVFMADDIAENEKNKNLGVIRNEPNGPNVYTGVPKDYAGKHVTTENFLNAITGNKTAMDGIGSGKVLASGPNDHVFINFVDHGAPGFVGFPYQLLSAKRLMRALKTMHEKKMYKKLVFYLEACESGSMFGDGLLSPELNIFASTAANATESSYACYFDKDLQTYLADVYSVKWMQNTDQVGTRQSLATQFATVRKETITSHVQEYGDMRFSMEEIQDFQGGVADCHVQRSLQRLANPTHVHHPCEGAVASPNVPLAVLYLKLSAAKTETDKMNFRVKLVEELRMRNKIAGVMNSIVANASSANGDLVKTILATKTQPKDFDCAEAVVDAFSNLCYNPAVVEFAMRQVYALVNMCEHPAFNTKSILQSIQGVCAH